MMLRTDRRKNAFLTQISLDVRNKREDLIFDKALPEIKVANHTDIIKAYPQDHLRREHMRVGRGGETPVIDFGGVTEDTYVTNAKGLKTKLIDEDLESYPSRAAARSDITVSLTDLVLLAREFDVATVLTTAASFTNVKAYTDDTKRWDAYKNAASDNSTPADDIDTAIETCALACGKLPNLAIFPWKVARYLYRHPNFQTKEVIGAGPANKALVAKYLKEWFNIEKILVPNALYVNQASGASDTWGSFSWVWGVTAFIGYVDPAPTQRSITCGATFIKIPGRETRNWNVEDPPRAEMIQVRENGVDEKLVFEKCGYLFTGTIQ
jgi:hypothetical protein